MVVQFIAPVFIKTIVFPGSGTAILIYRYDLCNSIKSTEKFRNIARKVNQDLLVLIRVLTNTDPDWCRLCRTIQRVRNKAVGVVIPEHFIQGFGSRCIAGMDVNAMPASIDHASQTTDELEFSFAIADLIEVDSGHTT